MYQLFPTEIGEFYFLNFIDIKISFTLFVFSNFINPTTMMYLHHFRAVKCFLEKISIMGNVKGISTTESGLCSGCHQRKKILKAIGYNIYFSVYFMEGRTQTIRMQLIQLCSTSGSVRCSRDGPGWKVPCGVEPGSVPQLPVL